MTWAHWALIAWLAIAVGIAWWVIYHKNDQYADDAGAEFCVLGGGLSVALVTASCIAVSSHSWSFWWWGIGSTIIGLIGFVLAVIGAKVALHGRTARCDDNAPVSA